MLLNYIKLASRKLITKWQEEIGASPYALVWLIAISGSVTAAGLMWGFAQIASRVITNQTEIIDTAILQFIYSLHNQLLDQIIIGITFFGEPLLLAFISLVFACYLISQRQYYASIMLAIVSSGGVGLNYLLKQLFLRDRPQLWQRVLDVSNYSFPSGHAMISLVVYGFIGYWFTSQYPRWRAIAGSCTIILILAIGFSRLYLGVHWPTDVVAGYTAGLIWLLGCILAWEVSRQYRFGKAKTEKQV